VALAIHWLGEERRRNSNGPSPTQLPFELESFTSLFVFHQCSRQWGRVKNDSLCSTHQLLAVLPDSRQEDSEIAVSDIKSWKSHRKLRFFGRWDTAIR